MVRRLIMVLTIALQLSAGPARAIDWPAPEGRMLDVDAETVTVHVPAPEWIGRAVRVDGDANGDTVRVHWAVPVGLDAEAQRLVVSLADAAHWDLGLVGYLTNRFFASCSRRKQVDLDLSPDNPDYMLTFALCGYDYGSGSGTMLLGLSRDANPPEVLLDLWYEVPGPPFDVADESAWPMSRSDLEATLRALDAAVRVDIKP